MIGGGLCPPFRRPLEFLFDGRLSQAEQRVVGRVESLRRDVARRASSFEVVNRDGKVRRLTAPRISHVVSVDPEWGAFLHLCAQSFRARVILELGGCAGISGCYLASSEYCERFITVEASPNLASLARENIRQVSDKAEVVNALFDDALDEILPTVSGGIDLAFIDGHHKYETTLHYFSRLERHLNEGALVVFDDIHLSEGMWRAWQVLSRRAGFAYTIGAGRFGVCSWDGSSPSPVNYNLCPYLGCFRINPGRAALAPPPKGVVADEGD